MRKETLPGDEGGFPPEIRRLQKMVSLEFPTHESQVCVKNPQEVP